MRVLVLGGTGSIGRGVVAALLRRDHDVVALARTQRSADSLSAAGATPLRGDLRDIRGWLSAIDDIDAIVHAAATWDEDMSATDRRVVETLIPAMAPCDPPKAFVYTGGTWKYGQTGDSIATEASPRFEIESFADSGHLEEMVLAAAHIRGMVIHPAMVFEDRGGILQHMYDDADKLGYIRVIGGESIRWPLVHHDDLGDLYALVLEQGMQGDVFNGSAIEGVEIGEIAHAITERLQLSRTPVVQPVAEAIREYGPWIEGYALDQQVSGRKAMDRLGWRPIHCDVIADIMKH